MSADRIRRIGLDPRWLLAALFALVAFQFALDGGGSETAIWVGGLFLGFHMAYGDCGIRKLPRQLLLVAAVVALILAMSWVFSSGLSDTHRSFRLFKFLIVIFSVYCLGRLAPEEGLARAAAAVIALVILWQFAIRHLNASPYGSFERSHYLAYFTLLSIPPLLLLSWLLQPPYRYAGLALLIPAVDLVLNDLSRPLLPLLSPTVAAGVVLFIVASVWRRWAALLWLGLCGAILVYLIPNVLAFFNQDERSTIWTDAWTMISRGGWETWVAGQGLGSFPAHFPAFSDQEFAYLSFPHNYFLELLYESGGLMLAMVMFALGYLAFQAVGFAWLSDDPRLRGLALCNVAMLVIWFAFGFFTFSFYSTYSLYPLAFIVGIHCVLADRLDVERARPA